MASRWRSPGPGVRLAAVFVGAPLVAVLVLALLGIGGLDRAAEGAPAGGTRAALDQTAERRGSDRPAGNVAVVRRRTALRARPDGRSRALARIGRRTEFGSKRVLAVVARRGEWLRVMDADLDNGKRGWIKAADTKPGMTPYKLRVHIRKRRIDVVRDGRVVRRVRAAVGENRSPTPTGNYAVTDKIPFTDGASPYGCCALALTAHQEDLPPGWTGGDRIAIHATPASASIGESVTGGCMRVPDRDAVWLMKRVPLGTPVSIRA
jgi:hypothetical protein